MSKLSVLLLVVLVGHYCHQSFAQKLAVHEAQQQTELFNDEEEGSGEELPPDNSESNETEEDGGDKETAVKCPTSTADLETKVLRMIEQDFPKDIHLPVYSRGSVPRIDLTQGMLYLKEVKLDNQPYCVERSDGSLRYDFKASMLDLSGSYSWNVYNFLRRNFSDAVVITARRVRAQFFFKGSPRKGGESSGDDSRRQGTRSDSKELNKLEDVKVEGVEDLDVNVSMPEVITGSAGVNRFLAYIASRVSTYVANRSRTAIATTIQNSIKNSIIAHMQALNTHP